MRGGGWKDLPPLQHCWLINKVIRLFLCLLHCASAGLFPNCGGLPPLGQSSSSEDNLSGMGRGAGSSWSGTLTLLDSIIPVRAWNLTVFNRARSFFSTLQEEQHREVGRAISALSGSCTAMMERELTFSYWEWPQSARSLREAWRASPATTRHQKHLWHGGCLRKRSSGLGWAGSCPSFDRNQTEL